MKLPAWAPADLVKTYNELKPKADAERKRSVEWQASNQPPYDLREELEQGRLYVGPYFVGYCQQFDTLIPLITKPVMEHVWKTLKRREGSFKFVKSFLYGGTTQAENLYGFCVYTEVGWLNIPKRTKTESKKLYEDIASTSLRLCELLIEVNQSRDLLDIRTYIAEERMKEFIEGLEKDDHELWYGFDGYLDHLLGQLLEPLPGYLLKLNRRASEHAALPLAVSQPNSPSAKLNYFIDKLSDYFKNAYGQPLHSHVAAVVSALFNEDIDEDRVRALLRSRKAASKAYARKKVAEYKKEITG